MGGDTDKGPWISPQDEANPDEVNEIESEVLGESARVQETGEGEEVSLVGM